MRNFRTHALFVRHASGVVGFVQRFQAAYAGKTTCCDGILSVPMQPSGWRDYWPAVAARDHSRRPIVDGGREWPGGMPERSRSTWPPIQPAFSDFALSDGILNMGLTAYDPMADEQEYLGALRSRDPAAWGDAFRELWGISLGAARRLSGVLTPTDIEDAAAEALEDVVDQVDRVGSREELRMLTVAIAYRRAISAARRKLARKRGVGLQVGSGFAQQGEAAEDGGTAVDTSPLRELEIAELSRLLQAYLSRLDADTRQLLFEKVVLGFTYAEMSRKHGKPIGSMCSKVARGLKAIRQLVSASSVDMDEFQSYLR